MVTRKNISVVWLAPFNLGLVKDRLEWRRPLKGWHPSSWLTALSQALMCRDDVQLHIVSHTPYVRGIQTVSWSGASITVVPSGVPGLGRAWPPNYPLNTLIGFPYEVWMLKRALRRLPRPSLVHVHGTEHPYGLVARHESVPWVISIQGIMARCYEFQPTRRFRWMRRWEKIMIQSSRFFICRTHFDTGFVRTLNPEARIFDIPEAITPVYFQGCWRLPANRRVLFLGGSMPLKGLHLLLQAISLIARSVPGLQLDVGGYVEEKTKALAARTAQERNFAIRFHGILSPEQIVELHHMCRVFALPSLIDNSPNTLAEALVSGMPAVAFDTGGIASMFENGVSGLRVPAGDVHALGRALHAVLMDDALASRLGAAAARWARPRHDPERVAEQTVEAYHEILKAAT